ncbi:Tyrosine aminotransferase [Thalictrum thalictroides]|uniref:Tyrosine aminotransferase n=1 Tax=Thalictrum thalictroides TaxID=46969 RepID=A0A7J6V2U7_THATH|nr:Tyrosine aminotransferase [Thalictrum thalictroides]
MENFGGKKKECAYEKEENGVGNGGGIEMKKKWCFKANESISSASGITIRGTLGMLMESRNLNDKRETIPLGHGDPSAFPCFRTSLIAEDAIVDCLRSSKFNSYSPSVGIQSARRAVAEYLSRDLSYELSAEDVFLTVGCIQSIEIVLSVLARRGANILLPRPGFPIYESRATFSNLEIRHFDLLPEKGWEVDLDAVKALADENTVAMVVINPGNPCGNVLSYQHMKKVAETARKLGILIISDEVYGHLTFVNNRFIPMGSFGSIAPVLTLGSISKRWLVPGWRLGWITVNDPNGYLKEAKIVDSIIGYANISTDPATFIQAAVPKILEETTEDFFDNTISILRESAEICYDVINEIDCIYCPHKPDGSMFVMVKIDTSLLEDIIDDMDFCTKLAKEESVIVLPGICVGMRNWLRITFAIEPLRLQDGLRRMKDFCQRHSNKL